jgi:Zn-dependent protease/predicted transcriptional regulator
MGTSIRLGKIFGVEIGIHWSWIFIFFIVTWSFAAGVFEEFYPDWSTQQRWVGGALVSAVFFVSVLLHELSHAIVSNRNGLPVKTITLFVFGGVANLSKEPDSAKLEFKIAVVGPLTSLALGALFAVLWAALYNVNDGVAGICANLALINASLAVFNMLPGFPLDGGRVFRSIVWGRNHNRLRATRTASLVGEWIAYGVMAIGVVETLFIGLGGLWLLLIGFFLKNAAQASYEQLLLETTLSGIHARDVMKKDFNSVPPDVNIEELVQDYVLRRNARCFAVIAAGEFAGLVTLTDIRNLEREEWPTTSVYRAMTPRSRLHTVGPDEDMTAVLQLMAQHDVNQVPVVWGREIVGMLERGDVMRFIQLRRDLDERTAASGSPDGSAPSGDGMPAGAPHAERQ